MNSEKWASEGKTDESTNTINFQIGAIVCSDDNTEITNYIPDREKYLHMKLNHSGTNVFQRSDLVVGRSTLGPHVGRGLFILLNENLCKGDTICVYFGRRLTPEEAESIHSNYKLFDPDAGWVVDAEGFENDGYFGGLINHAKESECNCYYYYDKENEIYLVKAIRDFKAGGTMELLVNYGDEYDFQFDRAALLARLTACGFKMPWVCTLCSFDNSSYPSICECCDSVNPDYATALSVANGR